MSHAECCPICSGTGEVDKTKRTDSDVRVETCHGCGGKGWVTVHDDETHPWLWDYTHPPVIQPTRGNYIMPRR